MSKPLYGLVLAGGKSRRMGQDKALLMRNGQSQLGYVASLLEGVAERVFVSARPDQQDDPERSRFAMIADRYEDIGPIAGILSAMDEHPDADWLVVACDLPNVDADTLEHLVAHRGGSEPFTAYSSTYNGLPEPLCAIYSAGSDSVLRGFVEDGILCPRKMLINSDTALLQQPNPAALDNINTPDDLAGSVLEAAS
ncbi:MAG: NTP transferase domain-containing protein [Woeseiaceae bacterium]|nr:NTP transferase domain-containing protein [Woeseiaceae bacterium]